MKISKKAQKGSIPTLVTVAIRGRQLAYSQSPSLAESSSLSSRPSSSCAMTERRFEAVPPPQQLRHRGRAVMHHVNWRQHGRPAQREPPHKPDHGMTRWSVSVWVDVMVEHHRATGNHPHFVWLHAKCQRHVPRDSNNVAE